MERSNDENFFFRQAKVYKRLIVVDAGRLGLRQSHGEVECTLISRVLFKQYILSFKWVRDYSRYLTASIEIHSKSSFTFPFITKLVLFWISKGEAYIDFSSGNRQKINRVSILNSGINFIWSSVRLRLSIAECRRKINFFLDVVALTKKPNLNSVLFLRTDLWFGLRSGGSITHIAGVINNLKIRSENLLFLTTDYIPTVSKNIHQNLLMPSSRFQDFSEVTSLTSNEEFYEQAIDLFSEREFVPSLIYQRYSINSFLGIMLSDAYKVPLVLEYNGSEVWISQHWGSRLKYENISSEIEMLNLTRASLIVVVSEEMGSELIGRGIEAKKLLVNPNGVDEAKYSPRIKGDFVRNKFSLNDACVVGFIGTFGQWHGVANLVKAFSMLLKENPELVSSTYLLLIGDGPRMQEVRDLIGGDVNQENIILTGVVEQEDGPKFLAACDILVAPHEPNQDGTQFFGSPTKLFEYMAMGKGIVASDLNQIGRTLQHNHTAILVKPGDIASLRDGILCLIKDADLRKKLGTAARDQLEHRHTWKHHTDLIIKKLNEL